VTKIPVACTLRAGDVKARVNEWREFLKTYVVESRRTSSTARLRLRDEGESVLAATELARREKTCCAFFEFRLSILTDAIWLEIEISDDAGISLDELSFLPAS
jgi:hypothetical protein